MPCRSTKNVLRLNMYWIRTVKVKWKTPTSNHTQTLPKNICPSTPVSHQDCYRWIYLT